MRIVLILSLLLAQSAQAQTSRNYISIVGSSTLYPFATLVAEHFGKTSDFRTPKIEATGTGGGFKLFCAGIGAAYPDISNASRPIKDSEREDCKANGIHDISEIKIGYDGIVLAQQKNRPTLNLTNAQIFLALAKQIPDPQNPKNLIDNPYQRWSDIDPSLPTSAIKVLGPPPSSGTRDAFVELTMDKGCQSFTSLNTYDSNTHKAICQGIREDGAFVEVGENDNLIVNKLAENPDLIGILGYAFLEENSDKIQAAHINHTPPSIENIKNGSYPLARPLYFYVKNIHIGVISGLKEYVNAFLSPNALGEYGYLSAAGLIAPKADELQHQRQNAQQLSPPKLL